MAISNISLSPAVQIEENDFSTYASTSAVTSGAIVGEFTWGPCYIPTLIQSTRSASFKIWLTD